jgi:small subunit ribosomal protein S3
VYGIIGIKVWIFKGEVYGVRDLSPNQGASNEPKGQRTPAPKGREKDGPKRRKRNS